MSGRIFAYALWCLAMVGLFVTAGIFSWSPFAEGSRAARGGGGVILYGPTHK